MLSWNSAISERSISAMATRKPRPSPSETATCRAIEPGPAMLASASAQAGGLVRLKRAASFCNSQPKPSSRRKPPTMPAEMESVMARSSDAAMARAKSANPAAAAVTMKASGGRSCSSVRWERISTAGGTTLARPKRQKHEEQHGEEPCACRGEER